MCIRDRWKGRINPGVSEEVVSTVDLAASFASLTGAELTDDACLDSIDVMDALLGEGGAKGRDHLIQQDNGRGGNYGLRVGKWKLQRHDSKSARNVVVETKLANTKVNQYRLFDLSKDPAEKNDLYATNKRVGERMKKQLEEIIAAGRSR